MKRCLNKTITFLILLSLSAPLWAVERVEINLAKTPYVDERLHLNVELDFLNRSYHPINDVRVYYRELSESRYQWESLQSEGFRYIASVNLTQYDGGVVEYFFDVEYADGSHQRYPEDAPETNLMRASVQQEFDSGGGILVISPEQNETVFTDEFLLTVSFFPLSAEVDPERTRLFLNTWDVSRYARVYSDFLTFAPGKVPPGQHTLRLELYSKTGRLLSQKRWSFRATQRKGPSPVSDSGIKVTGNLYGEYRNENLVDGTNKREFARSGLRLTADANNISFGARVFVSNQEASNLQPINRYTGWFQSDFWNDRFFRITGGDAYPQLNQFLLNNILVRGFYGQLFMKFLNLDFTMGQNLRGIEGSQRLVVNPTTTNIDTTVSPGTFKRDILGMRASFGSRENFQLGFTAVKGKDDISSIRFGGTPEESASSGVDLYLATDNNRLILEGSFNSSLYNPNILNGMDVPRDTLNNLGVDIPQNVYDLATSLITVNQYLVPYPGQAYHGQARLNVANNQLSVMYRYVEDDFHSLGQPFLLRDYKGFTISDQIRLFQNQLFLNLRYQDYENNLANTKPATTDNQTFNVNISYFPLRNLPSLTFGFNNHRRKNGLTNVTNPLILPEDNRTNTISFSTSYSFLLSDLKNRVTLNILNYDRQDDTNLAIDNLSNTLALILQTRYNIPLKTNLEFTFQQTENSAAQVSRSTLQINSFGLGAEYRFNQLFDQQDHLSFGVNGRLGLVNSDLTSIPINVTNTIDYNRNFFNGRLIYTHPRLGRISVIGDMINYTGDRTFRDYIVTARYDVKF